MKRVVLCLLLTFLLTGCSFSTGVENLLAPPRLTDSQEQIYSALQRQVGTKIKLRYPKSGSYLSAFVVADIDDEPTDEAIVFYERVGIATGESSLRINVLDMRNGVWESVYDLAGIGTDVEKIMISDMGEGKHKVVIGFSLISEGDKSVILYDYSDEILVQTGTYNYSLMELRDVTGDGIDELFTVSSKSGSRLPEARLISLPDGASSSVTLNENTGDFAQLIYGAVGESVDAFVVDEIISAGIVQTEIVTCNDGQLTKLLSDEGSSFLIDSMRSSSYLSCDLDSDGIIEIPMRKVFYGYEQYDLEAEQLPMVVWMNCENGKIYPKYYSYYSIANSYVFVLPERWLNSVTLRINGSVLSFCAYDDETDSLDGQLTELLSVVVDSAEASEARTEDGYQAIHYTGDNCCYVRVSQVNSTLSLTMAEALAAFYFL